MFQHQFSDKEFEDSINAVLGEDFSEAINEIANSGNTLFFNLNDVEELKKMVMHNLIRSINILATMRLMFPTDTTEFISTGNDFSTD